VVQQGVRRTGIQTAFALVSRQPSGKHRSTLQVVAFMAAHDPAVVAFGAAHDPTVVAFMAAHGTA
jgi:hypothetical protein